MLRLFAVSRPVFDSTKRPMLVSTRFFPRGAAGAGAARFAGLPAGAESSTWAIIWLMQRAPTYTSGWDECLVVVNDAMGEVQSVSIYDFQDGKLEKLRDRRQRLDWHSVFAGHAASGVRLQLRRVQDHGPGAVRRSSSVSGRFFEEAVELRDDGSIRIPILKLNQSRDERENYRATRTYLDEHLMPRRAGESVGQLRA